MRKLIALLACVALLTMAVAPAAAGPADTGDQTQTVDATVVDFQPDVTFTDGGDVGTEDCFSDKKGNHCDE